MTRRLKEKFNIPGLTRITRTTTRSLSLTLATLSLSAFRLFRSFLRRTLSFFPPMDDHFFSPDNNNNNNNNTNTNDTNFLDLDLDHRPSSSSSSPPSILIPNRPRLYDYEDDYDVDKLYLVPFRWWSEAQSVVDQPGVLYNVSSNNDDDDDDGGGGSDREIVLDLRKEEGAMGSGFKEEGFSGREYALVSESMWLRALKWHNDSKLAMKNVNGPFAADNHLQQVLLMQIRLSVSGESNSLVVKIRLKDNTIGLYKRACNILGPTSDLQRIWDFSGQTIQFLMDKRINLPDGSLWRSSREVPLELYLYGFSTKGRDEQSDGVAMYDKMGSSINSSLIQMNGTSDYITPYSTLMNSQAFSGYSVGSLGLTGLQNLGNTCFMNSAIQCLAHTPKLVDYFLGDYRKELNRENPLGMKGELALTFGELLRKLWSPGAAPVAPRMFKLKLANFARQFSGYNQHDSQEFLAFLLDGLHEDLNRVKHKPYIEAKDAEGCPDEEVAEEYWRNHRARNDSVIVDLCQGQYRSTLVCPNCKKNSVTFDPFMYLSLPLPSTTMRTMTVTVLDTDGITLPSPVTVTVPKCGRLKDLIDALSAASSLRDDGVLLVAEIYKNKIFRILEDPSDMLGLIRDDDKLVAYRLPKDEEMSHLVVFMHERLEKPYEFERLISNRKLFGIPLVARLSALSDGFDLQKQFLKLLSPFLMPNDDILDDSGNVGISTNEDATMEDVLNPLVLDSNKDLDGEAEGCQYHSSDFQFHPEDGNEIKMDEPLPFPISANRLDVCVFWSDEMIEKFDTCLLGSLPEVFKPQLFTRMPLEFVSLYKCLEAFLKEEPLGPEDMWYCPTCKKHRQAIKKLDLWRLPEILVVHLKRFSYTRFIKNKLETYVDFPIDDLDLSNYVSFKDGQFLHRYVLYAISNHYGGMGGGHYTAFIDHGHGKWFEFDDDRVFPVSEDMIKTSAAYVLFYRRVT